RCPEAGGPGPGRLQAPTEPGRPPPGVGDEGPQPRLLVALAGSEPHGLPLPVVVALQPVGPDHRHLLIRLVMTASASGACSASRRDTTSASPSRSARGRTP